MKRSTGKLSGAFLWCGPAVKQQKWWVKNFDHGQGHHYSIYGSDHPLPVAKPLTMLTLSLGTRPFAGWWRVRVSPSSYPQRVWLVSRARLSPHPPGGESGQIPIMISFLTRQEFLGVLIGLVTNGGARLLFLACCFERRKPAFAERVPIYVHTYFIRHLAAECAIQKPDGNFPAVELYLTGSLRKRAESCSINRGVGNTQFPCTRFRNHVISIVIS